MSEKWSDLSELEQKTLRLKFPVELYAVYEQYKSLRQRGLVEIIRIDHNRCLARLTDEGRALVESAADAGVTNACPHTTDGSVCPACLGVDSEKHLFDRVEEVLDLAEFYMLGELGEFPNVTRQTVSDFKKYKSLLEKEAQERQAEIERLRSELAAERQRVAELEASANEAQAARLAAVAEAVVLRGAITDFVQAEADLHNSGVPSEDWQEAFRSMRDLARKIDTGATLLERLAKLEAALGSVKDMPVVSMSMAGSQMKAYTMTIERMRKTAADALKGDDTNDQRN